MKRSLTAAAVVAATTLALTACSSSSTPTDGTVTLQFLGPENPETFEPVIDAFEASHPDVTVEYTQVPQDQLNTTLQQRLSAKDSSIDVFTVDQPRVSQLAAQRTAARPMPGETVLGTDVTHSPGGKGLNQAVAAARSGVNTALIGAVGEDLAGSALLDHPSLQLVNTDLVTSNKKPTGTALITLTPDGENSIIVVSGANDELTPDEVTVALDRVQPAIVISQLEIPLSAARAAARWAQWNGARFILNYSPYRADARDLLEHADPVIVNTHEATLLHGGANTVHELAAQLSNNARSIVITDGPRGSYSASRGDIVEHVPAHTVTVVDTTGAGDTFAGTLASALLSGASLRQAATDGAAAAAAAIQQARMDRT